MSSGPFSALDLALQRSALADRIIRLRRLQVSQEWQDIREALLSDAANVERGLMEVLANEQALDTKALVLAKNMASRVVILRNLASAPEEMAERIQKSLDEAAQQGKKDAEIEEMREQGEPIVPGGNV